MLKRKISILFRKIKYRSQSKKLQSFIQEAENEIQELPAVSINTNTLLLIRTDEIGDYLLSRNCLPLIRNSKKYKDFNIVFVGNIIYKSLAESLDNEFVNQFIWIEKPRFKKDTDYRKSFLNQIRLIAPSVAVELQRTTDLEYGDLIIKASNAPDRYGYENNYKLDFLNQKSASFYNHLLKKDWELTHEFFFNQTFVNWFLGESHSIPKPFIDKSLLPKNNIPYNYILCVIGSSKKSKNWPELYWVQLIKELLVQKADSNIILLGGKAEEKRADFILEKVNNKNVVSLVGKTSLLESLSIIAESSLLLSNDTFAIHARISLTDKPTVVLANGESAFRFTDLQAFSPNYMVLYAQPFLNKKTKMKLKDHWTYMTPSSDMSTISVSDVTKSIKKIMV